MTGFTGLILAAGRGSRLGDMTATRPKCLIELGGKPLLDWQISALQKGGTERVVVVTGYRHELIDAKAVDTIFNSAWNRTNMVSSLMLGIEHVDGPVIVSYSDIVYHSHLVRRLIESRHALAISYDLDWRDLWDRRFADPLMDAETFRVDQDDRILEIGGKTRRADDIQGQFMGLLRIEPEAQHWIRDLLAEEPGQRDHLDTTGLLMRLIGSGHPVHGVPTRGGWCEVDDQEDLAIAQMLFKSGRLGIE